MARHSTTTHHMDGVLYIPGFLNEYIDVLCPHCGGYTKIKPLQKEFISGKPRCNKCYRYYHIDKDYNTW